VRQGAKGGAPWRTPSSLALGPAPPGASLSGALLHPGAMIGSPWEAGMPQTWKYKIERYQLWKAVPGKGDEADSRDPEMEALMNKYGAEGWEAISVTPLTSAFHGGATRLVQVVYKRPA